MLMEIADEDLLIGEASLDYNVLNWNQDLKEAETQTKYSDQYSVLRHNVVSSPIVKNMYKLKFDARKPLKGLEDESNGHDGSILLPKMQKELRQRNLDSFDMDMDDFDDLESEMVKYTTKEDGVKPIEIDLTEYHEPVLEEIFITIQHTSIRVNNESDFQLPSTVRSSSILNGCKLQDGVTSEDSLLLSLTSGYLLLIRFYLLDESVVPYVVQWWRLEKNNSGLPKLKDTGRDILTHASGNGFAVTAARDLIRLYYCAQTPHGVQLDRLQNLTFDGTILHTCFLEPLKDTSTYDRALLFTMLVTSEGRYQIRLWEWVIEEARVQEHTPMSLPSDFGVPVSAIPILNGVLLVMEDSIRYITLDQILSSDHNLLIVPFSGGFPVSYYKPSSEIISKQVGNEALIAVEDGSIFSLILSNQNTLNITPILKVPNVSQFILENSSQGYHLLYSSDLSSGGYILLKELNLDIDIKGNSPGKIESFDKWDNWAPVLDVEVVDTKHNTQDLWIGHGKYLSKLKMGVLAEKQVHDSSLRKAYRVFHHIVNEDIYFIFTFIDKTLIFKYEQEELIDISDSGLDLAKRTINLTSFQNICFQITEDSIVVANFETDQILTRDLDNDVVLADCYSNNIAIVTDTNIDGESTGALSLIIFEVAGGINEFAALLLTVQPNFIKFLSYNGELFLLIGASNMILVYSKVESGYEQVNEIPIGISEPHDLAAANETVYISSRFGEYAVFDITADDRLNLVERERLKLTDSPIDFFLTPEFVLFVSKNIWKLQLKSRTPIPVVFQELRNRSVFSAIALSDTTMAVLRTDGFSITSTSKSEIPILKSIKVGQVLKKLTYISHLGIFAIITDSSLLFCNKLRRLEERLFSKDKLYRVFENETPMSLAEWILPKSNKSYRNLLVGCSTASGGSLKILAPKLSSNNGTDVIDVYLLNNIKTDGPVLATGQLDSTTILYSSGYHLYSTRYDFEARKILDPECVYTFNSIIVGIDIRGDDVLVSTKDYSVTKLHRGVLSYDIIEDDAVVRKVTNSLSLANNVTITTDKLHCTISGVQDQRNRFKSYVPFVPKLKKCQFLPKWYRGEEILRFLAYGFGGDIQVYTLLDKDQTAECKRHYKPLKYESSSSVTGKGLWEVNTCIWKSSRDINIFDCQDFDESLPDDIKELLGISI